MTDRVSWMFIAFAVTYVGLHGLAGGAASFCAALVTCPVTWWLWGTLRRD
jgi:hypothetical protein